MSTHTFYLWQASQILPPTVLKVALGIEPRARAYSANALPLSYTPREIFQSEQIFDDIQKLSKYLFTANILGPAMLGLHGGSGLP